MGLRFSFVNSVVQMPISTFDSAFDAGGGGELDEHVENVRKCHPSCCAVDVNS